MKTVEGLPLTVFILGGQSTVNLGRICKDFGRITSDSVDPGWGVNQQSTWEGSTNFERIIFDNGNPGGSIDSQLGKDL